MAMTIAEKLIQQGKMEGEISQRNAIEDICDVVGIELNDARRAQLEALDLAGLNRLRSSLVRQRMWPNDADER